jgi:hypothetical protein
VAVETSDQVSEVRTCGMDATPRKFSPPKPLLRLLAQKSDTPLFIYLGLDDRNEFALVSHGLFPEPRLSCAGRGSSMATSSPLAEKQGFLGLI